MASYTPLYPRETLLEIIPKRFPTLVQYTALDSHPPTSLEQRRCTEDTRFISVCPFLSICRFVSGNNGGNGQAISGIIERILTYVENMQVNSLAARVKDQLCPQRQRCLTLTVKGLTLKCLAACQMPLHDEEQLLQNHLSHVKSPNSFTV